MTIVETVVAGTTMVLLLGFALPAFLAAGDAGDEGAARVQIDSDTRHALFRMARELENTSTTATDGLGNPRLAITDGEPPDALIADLTAATPDFGGFHGNLGGDVNGENCSADDDTDDDVGGVPGAGAVNAQEDQAKGSGTRGGSNWGRARSGSLAGTSEFGSNANRPRHASIALNSVLTFQKVQGYTIGADGAPVVTWSTPIEYSVTGRKLLRTQDGVSTVLCPVCVGFQATLSDAGTLLLTLVSQKRTHARSRVVAHANQIEVSPKN